MSAAQHPGAGLGEDLPNHAEGRGQALGKAPDSPTRAGWELRHRGLGLPHDRARDPHQALVEQLHPRLGPLPHPLARPGAGRAAALGDLEDPPGDTAGPRADRSEPPQGARQHPHAIGQQRAVRRIVDVGLHDRRVHAQPPAPDQVLRPPQGYESGQHLLEDGLVEEVGQPDQRLRVRHALPVDTAERAIHQAAAHLTLTFVEAPVVEMLQDQEAQDHGRRRPQPAAALTLRMAPRQGVSHAVNELLVVKQRIDPAEGGIPPRRATIFTSSCSPPLSWRWRCRSTITGPESSDGSGARACARLIAEARFGANWDRRRPRETQSNFHVPPQFPLGSHVIPTRIEVRRSVWTRSGGIGGQTMSTSKLRGADIGGCGPGPSQL